MIDLSPGDLLKDASSLKGKVVLITGGASGFGRNTALLAAEHGAKVVIADLNTKLALTVCAEIRKAGGTCSMPEQSINVTKSDSLIHAFEHCLNEYGSVPDIVYANAGVNLNDYFEDDLEVDATEDKPAYPREPRYLTTNVDLNGAILTCALAQEYWRSHPSSKGEGRSRRLVVLSSMGGMSAIPGATTYSLSKHALLGYWQETCRKLQIEGEQAGFEFYAICPFFAHTRIFAPALLLVLAGIPLVPVPLIAKSMIHVASRPSVRSSTGGVVILPDHGDPAIAEPDEYDPLSPQWTATIHKRCSKTEQVFEWIKVRAFKRIWRDIAGNYYGTTSSGLFVKFVFTLCAITGTGLLVVRMFALLPPWVALCLGSAIGLAISLRGGL